MRKTFKREVAVSLLATIIALGANSVAADVFGYDASNSIAVLGIITVPFVAFAAAAFGMDSYAKQVAPQETPADEMPPGDWLETDYEPEKSKRPAAKKAS